VNFFLFYLQRPAGFSLNKGLYHEYHDKPGDSSLDVTK